MRRASLSWLNRFILNRVPTAAVAALLFTALPAKADLRGPYTPDAYTLYLFHFDEVAGGSQTTNSGSKTGSSYSVNNDPASTTPPLVTDMLGGTAYSTNGVLNINFGRCMTNGANPGAVFGYDYDGSGGFSASMYPEGGAETVDAVVLTNLNIGNGGQTPFTIEALVAPTSISTYQQEIVCTDNARSTANRGFQWRINNSGQLQFTMVGGPSVRSVSEYIPTSGDQGFLANAWYHVAVTYDGTTMRLYWTRLNPTNTAAMQLKSGPISLGTTEGAIAGPICFGSDNRDASNEKFFGRIDEVRISDVCRGAGEMQFFSDSITISPQPVSQNVDYGQPVTFTIGASSQSAQGYRWRFDGTPISGDAATNTSYSIAMVGAADAGSYDCVVTNTAGYAATSSPAILVVGAANFLAHRWSFTSDTSDSIGGAWGTNFGTAAVSGGKLVLDGTNGNYMRLPPYLVTNTMSAVTFEFWASYGVMSSGDNSRVFDFGDTNGVLINATNVPMRYVFFSPHNGANHRLTLSSAENIYEQNATAAGTLDGRNVHVTCVVDPPNRYLAIYTNGVLEVANTNMTIQVSSLNDEISYVGRSLYTNDAYLNASIDELRIYNGALSPSSVQQTEVLGPDELPYDGPVQLRKEPVNTIGTEGQPVTFTGRAVGRPTITYQWFENGIAKTGETNDTYTFIAAAGQNGNTFQLRATNNISGTNYSAVSSNATLTLTVPEPVVWIGGNSADWDTTTLNWSNATALVKFGQYDGVTFDSRGSGRPVVNLTQTVYVTNLTVNASTDYLLTSSNLNGSLNGNATLVKQGTGTVTVDVPNNLLAGTDIQAGTLQIGNGDDQGTLGGGPVTNDATLIFNRTNSVSVTNAISGTGKVTVIGGGSVSLSASNSYTGLTVITNAILYPRNASALGTADAGAVATNGGQLYIDANVDIPGESLTLGGTATSALHKGGAGTTTLGGTVTLVADTSIAIDGNATLNLTNAAGISGSGTSLILGAGGSAQGTVSGPITLGAGSLTKTGDGTWTLNSLVNSYSGKTYITGGTLMVGAAAALGSAPGSFTADQISLGTNTGTLGAFASYALNDGKRGITVDTLGGFNVASNVTLTIANAIAGSGTITKSGAGTLVLSGNDTYLGILNIDTASTSANGGATRIAAPGASGTLTTLAIRNNNSGYSTLQLDGSAGSITFAPLTLSWAGRNVLVPAIQNVAGNNTLSAGTTAWVVGGGAYQIESDAGTLTVTGFLPDTAPDGFRNVMFSGNGEIIVSGLIQDGNTSTTNSVVKIGAGTVTLTSANSYSGGTTISNGTLLINGSIAGSGVTNVGGRLAGTGTINSPVTIGPGGTLAPGGSVGTLYIYNDVTLAGNVEIAVDKSLSPSNSMTVVGGVLSSTGAGAVIVTNLGPALAVGDRFYVFDKAVVNGGAMAVAGGGAVWNNNLAVDGSISVQSTTVPHPKIATVSSDGADLMFSGTNGPANGLFHVLASTNVALPVTNWVPVLTNHFTGGGQFSVTNAITPGVPERFYLLQVQ